MPSIDFFRGKRVVDFDDAQPFDDKVVYRLRVDYYGDGEKTPIDEQLESFSNKDGAQYITSLIIGHWGEDEPPDASMLLPHLLKAAPKLKSLTGLVWGDIDSEECEISWIENDDLGALLPAFPKLEYLKIRGGMGLDLTNLNHDALKTLKIESGGLDVNLIQSLMKAHLPNLETLSLWLGSEEYGFNAEASDFGPLLLGTAYPDIKPLFPRLKKLALANSPIGDDLAEAMAQSGALLEQLDELDMSMGMMTDRGAQALAENEHLGKLKKIDLSSNYIADEDLFEQMKARGVRVKNSGQKEGDEYNGETYYYVDVAE